MRGIRCFVVEGELRRRFIHYGAEKVQFHDVRLFAPLLDRLRIGQGGESFLQDHPVVGAFVVLGPHLTDALVSEELLPCAYFCRR